MAKARRAPPVPQLDPLAHRILGRLLADFMTKKLGFEALQNGYIGLSLHTLVKHCCDEGGAPQVDFDLALTQLERGNLIDTGPKVPYDNEPGSSLLIIALISKREYAYLTEEGYRAANQPKSAPNAAPKATVHISGSHFHQSPIGIGAHVTQSITVGGGELAESVRRLVDQLERILPTSDLPAFVKDRSQRALEELREAADVPEPDVGRLRRGLELLKHIMEHAVGHLVATGVLAAIAELLSHAAH